MHIKSSHTQHYISTQAHLCKHCQAAEESQHTHDHWCASLLLHTERSCSPALQAWSSWHRCCHSAVVCMFLVGTGCSCRLNSPASSETLLCTGIWGFRHRWCSYLSRLQRGSLRSGGMKCISYPVYSGSSGGWFLVDNLPGCMACMLFAQAGPGILCIMLHHSLYRH